MCLQEHLCEVSIDYPSYYPADESTKLHSLWALTLTFTPLSNVRPGGGWVNTIRIAILGLAFGLLTAGLIVELALQRIPLLWQLAITLTRIGSWVVFLDRKVLRYGWYGHEALRKRPVKLRNYWPIALYLFCQFALIAFAWIPSFQSVSALLQSAVEVSDRNSSGFGPCSQGYQSVQRLHCFNDIHSAVKTDRGKLLCGLGAIGAGWHMGGGLLWNGICLAWRQSQSRIGVDWSSIFMTREGSECCSSHTGVTEGGGPEISVGCGDASPDPARIYTHFMLSFELHLEFDRL